MAVVGCALPRPVLQSVSRRELAATRIITVTVTMEPAARLDDENSAGRVQRR